MTQSLDRYVAEYENARRNRPGGEPAWLARTREKAFDRFLSLGFPTSRDEEWRFTSVAPLVERAFVLGGPSEGSTRVDGALFRLPVTPRAELVFVNGRFVASLSRVSDLPPGVSVENLSTALAASEPAPGLSRLAPFERQAFTALNTAFLADGAYIRLQAHTVLTAPIHVLFVSTDGDGPRPPMSHPRVVACLGEGSQASIVESYAGPKDIRYFTNTVTDISLGDNAILEHYKLQYESEQAYHIGTMHVTAGRAATFTSHAVSLGGALVRNEVTAVLEGIGAECTLNGLYLADGARHVDNHTTIDHAQPHCNSREVYKGILADRARGVFNGKIIVRPDAQKTDAKQTNRALLLSEDAQINTKPQLEIFANDVRCTHGAAVGQLDDEAIFYLRSRGFGEAEARRLLIHAFVAEVLHRMPSEPMRASVENVLERQLSRALAAAA
jgi:Fe-S cluster assembly protein SufD